MNAPLRKARPYIFWGQTQSLCETCLTLVPTKRNQIVKGGVLSLIGITPFAAAIQTPNEQSICGRGLGYCHARHGYSG